MHASDLIHPAPRPARAETSVPPQEVIANLAQIYRVAGLPPQDAWRSALADYDCFFRRVSPAVA